ncbi:MAG: hypothetical protein L6R42_006709 [Xanthoria sp. 1 TBL-2021]|nr:MAG: hypothetical protein L6R42_006709 [Xanthoria sp. 1 TBL-2021]
MCQIWKHTYSTCGHKAPTVAYNRCEALNEHGSEPTCDDPTKRKVFHEWIERECSPCFKKSMEGLSFREQWHRSLTPEFGGPLPERKWWFERETREIKEKGVDEGIDEEQVEETRKLKKQFKKMGWRKES